VTARVSRSRRAAADLAEIWRFIAADDPASARRFLERIEAVARLLAERPLMGRSRPSLAAGLRSFPVGAYVLYYRPTSAGIRIVRVLHGARDLSRFF
jgi:toxin ParE1/3/4